jgi:hypothetical protein
MVQYDLFFKDDSAESSLREATLLNQHQENNHETAFIIDHDHRYLGGERGLRGEEQY